VALGGDHASQYPDRDAVELLRLRCRLFVANAARCRGDYDEATEELELTQLAAEDLDIRDLAFWAEAKSFLASLLRDQRDFRAATREARASATLYQVAECRREQALATWQWAAIREQAGDFAGALATLREVLPQALKLPFARLHLDLRHAEAFYLARLGRYEEAGGIQYSLRQLYDRHPDKELLRQWLRGLVASGLGEGEEAEECFRFARDGFVQKKAPYDAALVTLDWTLHRLDAGRAAEVVPLALSMGRAFEALGVARETLASWSLLTQAAERLELDRAEALAWVEVVEADRAGGRRK
jgi:tetratricopeptide (TPR) repeat protein